MIPPIVLWFLQLPECACAIPEAITAARQGFAFHQDRRLADASAAYSKALRAEPPRDPSPAEKELILRAAPLLGVTQSEPLPLKDVAAILHPNGSWISYHLFWEDDIDFPDDNDPCDHEIIWVELDKAKTQPRAVYSYFHGRILQSPLDSPERPRIAIQWGKHGSLVPTWRADVESEMRETWQKLSTRGRDSQDSPLSRGWPLKFSGPWEEFIRFSKPVDTAVWLRKNAMIKVSCFNNAVINRHFLRYNFAAKTEWPSQLCH